MNRIVRLILLAFVAGAVNAAAERGIAAQSAATLKGTVKSAAGPAVAGAVVVLEATSIRRETRAGSDGTFTLTNVLPGAYQLTVRADGFLPSHTELQVSDTPPTLEIKLTAEPHFSEVVSVSPEVRSQFESYQPTSVLGGQDLARQLQGTLGATLGNEPGVATRSFGPGPARPVIRGLDGDRVLILTDGQRMGDLSSQSGDHGVNVNPASAEKIEVVRGPATLLYGANAIGGLVNVVTKSIPVAPVVGATGNATFDGGSAAGEGGGAGDLTIGNGRLAFHVAGSGRRAGDYGTPDGAVPNSFNRAAAFEAGFSKTSDDGFVGGSVGYDRTHYGIPFVEAGETNLNPRRRLFDVRAERRNLSGFINGFRASGSVRLYNHDELDGEEIATSFTNNVAEFGALFGHRPSGPFKGTLGVWGMGRRFLAEGEEALSPEVRQTGVAVFIYEEATVSPRTTIQFGGRVEHAAFSPADDFRPRDFTNFSGSAGLLVHPNDQTTIALSLARAARNPALEELYFHGPHPGNNAIENGNDALDSEHAIGFDASFRWHATRASGEVTFFTNHVTGFIFREPTGEIDPEEGLAVTFFNQADANLRGFESHVDLKVTDLVTFELGADYVRGDLSNPDGPLPRMPPLRGRLGVKVQKNALQIGVDTFVTARQDRIFVVDGVDGPVGETPTSGYALAKAYVAYSFVKGGTTSTVAFRLDNIADARYRNHLNFLKDLAPEVGRDVRLTWTVGF